MRSLMTPPDFTVTTTYTGGAADKTRSQFEEDSRKDIEDSYVKYYGYWLSGIQRDRPIDYSDDSRKNELTVKEYYSIPNLWTIDKKGKRSFDFVVRMIRDYLPDIPETHSAAPLSLTYPLQVRYTLHLTLPEEWEFNSGPLHIRNKAYQFDFTRDLSGKEMTLQLFPDHLLRSYRRRRHPPIQGRLQRDRRPYLIFPVQRKGRARTLP